jgi:hypothetical protein
LGLIIRRIEALLFSRQESVDSHRHIEEFYGVFFGPSLFAQGPPQFLFVHLQLSPAIGCTRIARSVQGLSASNARANSARG